MYRELLLGCGHKRDKRMFPDPTRPAWENLVTLDSNADCKPDVIGDLESWGKTVAPVAWKDSGPLGGTTYAWPLGEVDEIHAYEVLEHLGRQGDYAHFFRFFTFVWHLLNNGGYFCATVPTRYSPWLWGDPGHRRAILQETLIFLNQPEYTRQCGVTSMSDYRFCYKADFDIVSSHDDRTTHAFILRAVKPSRISV